MRNSTVSPHDSLMIRMMGCREHPFFAQARPVRYVADPKEIQDPTDDDPTNDPLLFTKGDAWRWQREWRIVWAEEEPKLITFPRDSLGVIVLGEWFQQAGYEDL